jgi:hypothetical protein
MRSLARRPTLRASISVGDLGRRAWFRSGPGAGSLKQQRYLVDRTAMPSLLEIIQAVVAIMIGVSVGVTVIHALSSDED